MAQAGTVWVDVRGDTKGFLADVNAAARRAGSSFSPLAAGKTVLGDIGQVAGVAAIAVGGIAAAAAKTSMEFDASMSVVKAVSGATGDQLDQLREAALEAGASTVFSATEAAEAQQELVRAGVSVADVMGGALVGSLGLAAAGQLELKDAAEIAAQAMNIFKLEGEDVGYIGDVLAAGANKSAADVKQLGDALRQGGLVASQMGIGLEETIGTLSAFADNALIGSDAGTSFKVMLQRLTPATGPASSKMTELGLSFFNARGEFVGLEESAQRLQDSMRGLTEEQRSAAMEVIFGSDGVRAANILYEAGAAGVREYTAAVADEGAATRMAAENLNNLKGDLEEFSGANETALIRIGDLFDGFNRAAVQSATGFVNVFNDFAGTPAWDAIESNIRRISLAGGGVFDYLTESLDELLAEISPQDVDRAFDRLTSGLESARSAVDGLEPIIAGVGASLSTLALRQLPLLSAIVPAISPITGVLAGLVLGTDEGRAALSKLGSEAAEVGREVGPQLTVPLSKLAGEVSEGLAVAMDRAGGAALDAAKVLGPVLGDAIEELAPALGDAIEAGGELAAEVLPLLANLAGDVIPPAVDVMGAGLRLAAGAAELLADNLWLLGPAAGAFVALKFGDQIGNAAGTLSNLAGAARTAGSDFRTYFGVLREEGATVGQAIRGAATETGGLSSALGGLNPAVLAVTGAVTVGAIAYANYAKNKERVRGITDDLLDALDEEAGKFRELTEERSRQAFVDKEALDAQNRLGISLSRLTEVTALYGDEARRLDDLWRASGLNTEAFRRALEELPGPIREIGNGISDLVDSGAIEPREAMRFFQALDELAQGTAGSIEAAKAEFESLAREAAARGDLTATELEGALQRIANAQTPDELNQAFLYLSDLLGGVGGAAVGAASDIERLQGALEELIGIERDADEASRRWKDSIDNLNQSFIRNGAGIDQNTEAGRRNADAIQQMVERAESLAEAQARTDVTGKASSETFQQLQRDLYNLYQQGLLTEAEYQDLLDLYDLTPEEIQTRIDADTTRAEAEIADIRRQIRDIEGVSEPQKAFLRAALDAGSVRDVIAFLDAMSAPRTVTIKPRYEQGAPFFGLTGITTRPFDFGSFTGKKRASGGPVWPGTWLVGEEGPELLHLGTGMAGRVSNASDTERILTDAKAPAGDQFGSALLEEFRAMRAELVAIAREPKADVTYQVVKEPDPDDLSRKLNRTRIGAF